MENEIIFNFDFFGWDSNPFKNERNLTPQHVISTEQRKVDKKKILKCLFDTSRRLIETTNWNDKTLKQKVSVLLTLRVIYTLFGGNEWDMQRYEMRSWLDLTVSSCRSTIDKECIEIEDLLAAFHESLKYTRDHGTAPPPKYSSAMSKLDQASVDVKDFVKQFEAQYNANMKNFQRIETTLLRKGLTNLGRDVGICLANGKFRILRRHQAERLRDLFRGIVKLKDELLDLLGVCRAHFSFCQDLLEKFRLESFSSKQFDVYVYITKHDKRLAECFSSDKSPPFPFKSPYISELKDSDVVVSNMAEYEALKKIYIMLRDKVSKIKEDLPRSFPIVVANLCTHNGQPQFTVATPSDFFALMVSYNSYLLQLNSLAEGWSHTIRKLFEFMEAVVLFDPAREAECAKVLEESKLGDITPEEFPSPRAGLSKKPLSEEMRDLFKPLTRKNEQGGNKGSPSYANSSAASPSTSSSGPSSSSAASSNKPSAGAWLSNAFKGQTFFNKPKEEEPGPVARRESTSDSSIRSVPDRWSWLAADRRDSVDSDSPPVKSAEDRWTWLTPESEAKEKEENFRRPTPPMPQPPPLPPTPAQPATSTPIPQMQVQPASQPVVQLSVSPPSSPFAPLQRSPPVSPGVSPRRAQLRSPGSPQGLRSPREGDSNADTARKPPVSPRQLANGPAAASTNPARPKVPNSPSSPSLGASRVNPGNHTVPPSTISGNPSHLSANATILSFSSHPNSTLSTSTPLPFTVNDQPPLLANRSPIHRATIDRSRSSDLEGEADSVSMSTELNSSGNSRDSPSTPHSSHSAQRGWSAALSPSNRPRVNSADSVSAPQRGQLPKLPATPATAPASSDSDWSEDEVDLTSGARSRSSTVHVDIRNSSGNSANRSVGSSRNGGGDLPALPTLPPLPEASATKATSSSAALFSPSRGQAAQTALTTSSPPAMLQHAPSNSASNPRVLARKNAAVLDVSDLMKELEKK